MDVESGVKSNASYQRHNGNLMNIKWIKASMNKTNPRILRERSHVSTALRSFLLPQLIIFRYILGKHWKGETKCEVNYKRKLKENAVELKIDRHLVSKYIDRA